MDLSRKSLKTFAKEKLKGRWGVSIGVTVVACLLGAYGGFGFNGGGGGSGGNNTTQQVADIVSDVPFGLIAAIFTILSIMLIWLILAFVIGPVISLGERTFYMGLCRDEPVKFKMLFSKMSVFLKAWCLNFMMSLFIGLWTLLLVVPGIIAYYRYYMAKYIMAEDTSVGVMEAIRRSKEMMKGYKGKLFVLQLSFIGWALLCGLTLGIGYLWLVPYMRSTETAFYLELSKISATPSAEAVSSEEPPAAQPVDGE